MYSPIIRDDLIPILYRYARAKGKPMTRIVDEILRPVLVEYERQQEIPYCVRCDAKLELVDRSVTTYCAECKSETFVVYVVPYGERKEVI